MPSWPLIDEAISFQSGPNSPAPFPYWCSVLGRTQGRWSSRRGRQYELDQVQAGTVTSTLRNLDAAFDPSNTSSPFYPQVTPWRGYRRRAQLPATVNLLTADQATVFYASKGAYSGSTLPQWVGTITGSAISIHANGSSNYYAVTVPASTNFETVAFYGFSVTPGQAYTGQCGANCSTGVTAQVALRFVDVNGNTLTQTLGGSTTSATGAVITVTATAPSNAAGGYLYVQNTTAAASAGQFNVWNVQVEANASASAWAQPGTWYDIFTGYVERWPQTWTNGGTYGTSQLTCVDAIAYLSQRRLRSPAYMELIAKNPNFLYPLDEASGSLFYDLTAQQAPVPFANLLLASGGPSTSGNSLANATTGGPVPLGIPGPVPLIISQQINLGARGAVGPPSGAWTRILAFQVTTAIPANSAVTLWNAQDASGQNAIVIYVGNASPSPYYVSWQTYVNGSGTGTSVPADQAAPLGVGGWHFLAFSYDNAGNVAVYLDNGPGEVISGVSLPAVPYVRDWVGGPLGTTGTLQMAVIAELPYAVTTLSAWQQLYSAFQYGGSGLGVASSYSRYNDVLRWAQWAGASSADNYTTGECNTYGPSVDLLATAAQPGTDAVSAAQTVVDTDDGEHFVDRSGVVAFHARRHRFNQTTPVVTFGDGSGEIPYIDCSFGLDPTRLANDAAITQTSTQAAVTKLDTASIDAFGDVQLQRNVNDTDAYSLADMAQYLATHYANPVQRLEILRVEPATYTVNGVPSTAAWQALLSLDLGMPVAINRRPPGVPTISFSGFVEQINWTMDDTGRAVCELQVSPNYGKQFWQLDSSTFSVLGSTTICGY